MVAGHGEEVEDEEAEEDQDAESEEAEPDALITGNFHNHISFLYEEISLFVFEREFFINALIDWNREAAI